MIGNDCISQGYKSSSLSIIPENWEVKRLGEFSTFFSGGTPKSNNALYYGGNIPFIRSGEICKDKTELFLSQEGFDNSSAKIVEEGDILYALYGANSGQCSLSKIKGAINQAILCVRPKADKYYIMSVLQLNKEHYYNSYLQGGQGNLSGKIVSNYKIALPPIGEQKKIVEVLSEWDKAIELQTKLIEELELRKRALMQRLLTGRVRLNGFSDKWEKKKLDEIGTFEKGYGVPKEKIKEIGYKAIVYGEIYTQHDYVIKKFKSYIDNVTAKVSKQISCGAILFAGSGETLEDIGKCVAYIDNDTAYAGGDIIIFNPIKEINSLVLSYYLNSPSANIQKRKYGQGYSVVHIYKKDLANIQIFLPSFSEQTAIGEVLSIADKEIEIARTKLSLFRNQKRGLMQQLLTGKKRIMSSQISN